MARFDENSFVIVTGTPAVEGTTVAGTTAAGTTVAGTTIAGTTTAGTTVVTLVTGGNIYLISFEDYESILFRLSLDVFLVSL